MLPVVAVIAAAVLFGTTGTAQALGPPGATPLGVGAVRVVVGGVALGAVGLALAATTRRRSPAARERRPRPTARALGLMGLTGVCLAAYQPLFFLGTSRNGVAAGTVLALGAAPVLAGVLETALTRTPPRRTWVMATALCVAGVAVLAAAPAAPGGTDPAGVAASLGAGAAFAVFSTAQRILLADGWDPFTVAGAMGWTAAVAAVPLLPLSDLSWVVTTRGIVMTAWLGVATVAVAYTLFTWGLRSIRASTAATLTLTEPLTATVLGVAVLSEGLSPGGIGGLALLLAGLVLVAWGARGDAGAPSTGPRDIDSAGGGPLTRGSAPRSRRPRRPPRAR